LVQVETELDLSRGKEHELIKEIRRLEKRNKDLMDQINEEQTKLFTLTEAYDKIQDKMKKYKGQVDGAEEIANNNLAKCKRLQRELEDAEERAESMARSYTRASSMSR
jgi:myosin heavy chain 1/2/3/4/8/13/7B/15